jgi:hypothetical protein
MPLHLHFCPHEHSSIGRNIAFSAIKLLEKKEEKEFNL